MSAWVRTGCAMEPRRRAPGGLTCDVVRRSSWQGWGGKERGPPVLDGVVEGEGGGEKGKDDYSGHWRENKHMSACCLSRRIKDGDGESSPRSPLAGRAGTRRSWKAKGSLLDRFSSGEGGGVDSENVTRAANEKSRKEGRTWFREEERQRPDLDKRPRRPLKKGPDAGRVAGTR